MIIKKVHRAFLDDIYGHCYNIYIYRVSSNKALAEIAPRVRIVRVLKRIVRFSFLLHSLIQMLSNNKAGLIAHGMHKIPLRLLYSVIGYKSLMEPLQPLSWSKKRTIPLQILIKEPHSVLSGCDSSHLSFLFLTSILSACHFFCYRPCSVIMAFLRN